MILTTFASSSDTAVMVGFALAGVAGFVIAPIARHARRRRGRRAGS